MNSQNKVILITGVSRGIGKALAQKFLAEGYFVIGTSRAGESDISHQNLILLPLDLADAQSIKSCASKILELEKPIDILVNNAAQVWSEKDNGKMEIHVDILRKTLETNLVGPIDFTLQILPVVVQGGHIINISSRQGSMSYVKEMKNPSYQISKAGVNMFTRVLAAQLKDKITVSCVHPGAVLTDMAAADASMQPEEAAVHIYNLAISKPETGQFWFKGEKFPW